VAKRRMASGERVGKVVMEGQADRLREMVAKVVHEVMAEEVEAVVGAGKYERSEGRMGWRNGTRSRHWDTRVGTIELAVPRVRGDVAYFPSFLEYRRRSERALMAALVEMVLKGVSTRKAEHVLQVMGVEGMSASQLSRFLGRLDEHVKAFREAPIDGAYPYVWLDAKYERVRSGGVVAPQAVLVAIGVRSDGRRRVLGVGLWPNETKPGWTEFLESLIQRGLSGVKLVISDAHLGLQQAIRRVFIGAAWQRCRVHFMRNVLANVHRSKQPIVAALVKTIFAQSSHEEARAQLAWVAAQLAQGAPTVAAELESAEDDILAYMTFPEEHWPKLHSTNVLERLNREFGTRTRLVGIFPSETSLLRFVTALLMEIDDDWQVDKRYIAERSMTPAHAEWPALPAPTTQLVG
jgi:putative transposase